MVEPLPPVTSRQVPYTANLEPEKPWLGEVEREKEIRRKEQFEKNERERHLDKQSVYGREPLSANNKIDTLSSSSEEGNSSAKESAVAKKESKISSIVNFGKWLWEQFTGIFSSKKAEEVQEVDGVNKTEGVGGIGNKPKLEQPTVQLDRENLNKLLKEMRDLLNQIKSSNEETENNLLEDQQKAEVLVYALLLKSVKMQQKLKEEEIDLGKETVQMHHASMVEIREKYFNLQAEIIDRTKTSKVLGWVTTGLTAAILCVAVAGLALTAVASFGATAPVAAIATAKMALFLAGAVLGVANGGLTVSKGVLTKKSGEQEAQSTSLRNTRENDSAGVKDYMDMISKDFDKFLQLIGMLRQVAENDHKAKSAQNI